MRNRFALLLCSVLAGIVPLRAGAETRTMYVDSVDVTASNPIRLTGGPILVRLNLRSADNSYFGNGLTTVSGSPRLPFTFEFYGSSQLQSLRYANFMGADDDSLCFLYEVTDEDKNATCCRFEYPLDMKEATITREDEKYDILWTFQNQSLSARREVNVELESGSYTMVPDPADYASDPNMSEIGGMIAFRVPLSRNEGDYWSNEYTETIVTGCPKLPFQFCYPNDDRSAIRFAEYCGTEDNGRCLLFAYETTISDDSACRIVCDVLPIVLKDASIVRTNSRFGATWQFSNRDLAESSWNCNIDFHQIESDEDGSTTFNIVAGETISIPVFRKQKRNGNDIRLKAASQSTSVATVTKAATISGDDGVPAVFEVTGVSAGETYIDVETKAEPVDSVQYNVVVHPRPMAKNVVVQQRYPWNGLVDVTFDLTGDANCRIALSAVVEETDEALPVSSVTIAETESEDLLVSPGEVHLVWDAGRDVPGRKFDSVRMTVTPTAAF